MTKIALPEGQWFETSEAIRFNEDTWWDGSNCRSFATGSQWEHQRLFYTRHGSFVLHTWSQWEGSPDRYEVIAMDEAARWLIRNDCHDVLDELPADAREEVAAGIAKAEV